MADPLIIWFGDSFAQFACEAQPKRVVIRKRAARPFYDGRHMSMVEAESLATNVISALKQKGPAEAATSPSHGPTTPTEGTAMDKPTDTSTPTSTARTTFNTIVDQLGYSVNDMRMFASLMDTIA